MDVTGKIALVTGGGRGIGRGIVLALAENGADVCIGDINLDDAQAVADEVADMGRQSMASYLDVTNQESVESAVYDTTEHFSQIDILVNNAGVVAAPGWEERERPDDSDWDMILAVNLRGMARVAYAVSDQMKGRHEGKIINIASIAGRQGSQTSLPYAASKAGVINLTQSLALELASHSINVNAICPGLLWTPMWGRIGSHMTLSSDIKRDDLETKDLSAREVFDRRVKMWTPLGRPQTPKDVGNLAAFLASDYARNITGQAINVDGGFRMN